SVVIIFQEDHEKLIQEIQKLQENRKKDEKRLNELRKQIETNEGNRGSVGEELKEDEERANDSNENRLSFKADENIHLKKIESEAEDAFNNGIANLRELETDIGNMMKRMASPVIQKFEELKLTRKKSSKDTKMLKIEVRFFLSYFPFLAHNFPENSHCY
ncbi:unnamed protein product, partial [Brugia pahangi]|uniref:Uncharacterized protein n=1 Tax=Brugia pahangi TaxID=6280 RepID=A0A0N4TEV7_BRUPA